MIILPSEEPSSLGRCNCDTLSPKSYSNVKIVNRGFADEAVVIVKFDAVELMVTLGRVKRQISNRKLEVKDGTGKRS